VKGTFEFNIMLLEQIRSGLKIAQKQKDELRVGTLRLLLSEIHNRQIQKQAELTDEEVVSVIRQQVKQRQEAIEAYQKGKREDLVRKEREELEILSKYLPQQMSPQQLEKIVKEVISEMGARGVGDFGKVMGAVMGKVKGRAEGAVVAEIVKANLQ
jgi:uncharacterized protein YqeY